MVFRNIDILWMTGQRTRCEMRADLGLEASRLKLRIGYWRILMSDRCGYSDLEM